MYYRFVFYLCYGKLITIFSFRGIKERSLVWRSERMTSGKYILDVTLFIVLENFYVSSLQITFVIKCVSLKISVLLRVQYLQIIVIFLEALCIEILNSGKWLGKLFVSVLSSERIKFTTVSSVAFNSWTLWSRKTCLIIDSDEP